MSPGHVAFLVAAPIQVSNLDGPKVAGGVSNLRLVCERESMTHTKHIGFELEYAHLLYVRVLNHAIRSNILGKEDLRMILNQVKPIKLQRALKDSFEIND